MNNLNPETPSLSPKRRSWLKDLVPGSTVAVFDHAPWTGVACDIGVVVDRTKTEIFVQTNAGLWPYTAKAGTWTADPDNAPEQPSSWIAGVDEPQTQHELRMVLASQSLASLTGDSSISGELLVKLRRALTSPREDEQQRAQRLIERAAIFESDLQGFANTNYP